jgi:hypothetical protein
MKKKSVKSNKNLKILKEIYQEEIKVFPVMFE